MLKKSILYSYILKAALFLTVLQIIVAFVAFPGFKKQNAAFVLLLNNIVFITAAVSFSALFIRRKVVIPLSDMGRILDGVSPNNLSFNFEQADKNELGILSKKIGNMTGRLSEDMGKCKTAVADISELMNKVDIALKTIFRNISDGKDIVSSTMESLLLNMESAKKISSRTGTLLDLSGENVTSTLEVKAFAEEIASNSTALLSYAEDTLGTSIQMEQITKIMSENAVEISNAVQDALSSLQQISTSLSEVKGASAKSSELAKDVTTVTSEMGMMAVVDAVEGIERITEEAKKSADIITTLNAHSKDIQKILSVIRDVTAQTNLLSLNAAILAVQAGEYGKSFSVVAEEMNALAERTAASTSDIEKVIWTIQEEINKASSIIKILLGHVDEGNGLILKVGDALRQILHVSMDSEEMAGTIEKSTAEQSLGIEHVVRSIEDIKALSEKTSSSAIEHNEAIKFLLEKVSTMKDNIGMIKKAIDEQAQGTTSISKNLEVTGELVSGIALALEHQNELHEKTADSVRRIEKENSLAATEMEKISRIFGDLNDKALIARNGNYTSE